MPALDVSNAAPSTLTTVIGQVKDVFDQLGDATPIMVGGHYREWWGTGSGPKVLFVPEPPGGGGRMTGGMSLGATASQVHACDVFVRVDEKSTADLTRFDDLYALNDFVADCIRTAGSGHCEFGACSDDSPLRVPSGLGCALAWSFTYQRDIRHGARRWRGPARDAAGAILDGPLTAPLDTSPPVLPTSPAAIQSNDVDITLTVTAEE